MHRLPLTVDEVKERLLKVPKLIADTAIHTANYDAATASILLDLGYTIENGSEIKFRSPVDGASTTGLLIYYPDAVSNLVSKRFMFADANGNNIGAVDNLFTKNAVVNVILDLEPRVDLPEGVDGAAFVQNADTNAYIERTFIKKGESGNENAIVLGTGRATGDNSTVIGSGAATGVGATTIGSGTASGDYSVAFGKDVLAGCMGYYIAAIDTANRYIYLHTGEGAPKPTWDNPSSFHDESFESGYQILENISYGNEFSVSADGYYHWPFAGDVVEISGNRLTYSETNTLDGTSKWQSGEGESVDPCIFFIPIQSDIGFTNVGTGSVAEGWNTHAAGQHSHVEGYGSIVAGRYGHAEGNGTRAGFAAHSEGVGSFALGHTSHAEGSGTKAVGEKSHAEGTSTQAIGNSSHAEGESTTASGLKSHAEGYKTQANGVNSHAEGFNTLAIGNSSHAEGYKVATYGSSSHAEGYSSKAFDISTLGENPTVDEIKAAWDKSKFSLAYGNYSHAEGYNTLTLGSQSHAEGAETVAGGYRSHAEGHVTVAQGDYSHAENAKTQALGKGSHAQGSYATASGEYSHAAGRYTVANSYLSTALGQYNKTMSGTASAFDSGADAFVIGNGANASARSNAFRVTFKGTVLGAAAYVTGGADYAEYFEWSDGNPNGEDRIGRFVVLDNGCHIKLANGGDEILGVISGFASVIGDAYEDTWSGMYIRDIYGRPLFEEVQVEYEDEDEEGNVVTKTHMETHLKLNPDFDPEQEYIPRSQRPEWDAVGLMGKLVVIDDGSCVAGGRCTCGANGIATVSNTGYNVLKRLDETHIQILLK